jgi:hypothetical protein
MFDDLPSAYQEFCGRVRLARRKLILCTVAQSGKYQVPANSTAQVTNINSKRSRVFMGPLATGERPWSVWALGRIEAG